MKAKLEDYVLNVLEVSKLTRDDDFLLYCAVIKKMGIDTTMPFKELMLNHLYLGMPSFESVSRCRRKIAEKRPELSGNKQNREIERQKILDYVKNN